MDITNAPLQSYLVKFLQLSPESIDPEKIAKFEWFIKRAAIDAVTPQNKNEFNEILSENNLEKLSLFIRTYVPDFSNKLKLFLSTV